MSRLHFKGGPWTNAEDEVLKAGLAQYGLRDWERVASMLTKKTSAQCRERWENYIDPRLNIHEAWSLEEEEQLVELQSLFPNKFRLISEQLTRRTPNHYIRPAWLCEQRYLELKDEQDHYVRQQQQEGSASPDAAKQSLDEFMGERRRRRNARKTHEERAARVDTVSGERFESEMVAMATSRLANQDQKKGLRKERQRQLEEAAFLAKLESNREGIESSTLSLRQSKKMRKALEEDHQATGLVDHVAEDGMASSSAEEDDHEGDADFTAIDMFDDQQQAGLVKKQRVLMKDLRDEQRRIQQQLQQSSGNAEEDGGEGGQRARAALTGVNQDLLKQLTSGPSSSTVTTTKIPLLSDRAAVAKAESEMEMRSSLADLFASLPTSTRAATTTTTKPSEDLFDLPSLPAPGKKRPRVAHSPPSVTDAPSTETHAPSIPDAGISSSAFSGKAPSSAQEAVRVQLDLPAPRKIPKKDEQMDIAPTAVEVGSPSAVVKEKQPSRPPAKAIFANDAEATAYVHAAQHQVAVDCERALLAAHRRRGSPIVAASTARAEEDEEEESFAPFTIADRSAAEALVQEELAMESAEPTGPVQNAVTAAQAYVQSQSEYGTSVNIDDALQQLMAIVAAQVQEANALLRPVRHRWEQTLTVAMANPTERHALSGYLREDGQMKAAHAPTKVTGEAGTVADASHISAAAASYMQERLLRQCNRVQQETKFVAARRDRERLAMRRALDFAEHELSELQAREKLLQDLYRQKRAGL